MTDRELLEFAAKAAGIANPAYVERPGIGSGINQGPLMPFWNPLTNDGDALRLAVKLEMCLDLAQEGTSTFDHLSVISKAIYHDKTDPYAATRRAIVRAAAEIGRGKS